MEAEPVLLIASRRAIHAGWPSLSFQCNRCVQPLKGSMDRRERVLPQANY